MFIKKLILNEPKISELRLDWVVEDDIDWSISHIKGDVPINTLTIK